LCRIFAFMPKVSLPDAASTRQLGAALGQKLVPGDLVCLSGPLGAGKTTFSQGLAQALGIADPISSPTFVLMNEYEGPIPLLHLDAYRMEDFDYDELRDAGFEEFLGRGDAVRLIEWPEMVERYLPRPRFHVVLEIDGDARWASYQDE
jgi:tRNA threonylcarbamoyladenosine biosynthesis protein TsaE